MSTDFNKRAEELIAAGRLLEARAMLETAVREMLPDWRPRCDTGKAVVIAFWSLEEFLAFIDNQTEESDKPTFWTGDSYSRAWYQLAVIAVKGGRFEEALFCLDRGLDLEPGHPALWCEKGYAANLSIIPKRSIVMFAQLRLASGPLGRTWRSHCVGKGYN